MSHAEPPSRRRFVIFAGLSVFVALCVTAFALTVGPANILWTTTLRDLLSSLGLGHSPATTIEHNIIWQIRAPRVAMEMLCGAMLAVAGGTYQGVFRNPLADPYFLGISSGAGLGATIAIVASSNSLIRPPWTPWLALAGALFAVSLTWTLGGRVARTTTATLILAGVAVSSVLSSAQIYVLQTNTKDITQVYFWILGSLSSANWSEVRIVLPYVVSCAVVCVACGRALNVLSVGDLEARSLGLPVTRVRLLAVFAASLGTAVVVSEVGLVGFVGIIVPHIIRLSVGTSYRRILPLCASVGAGFMVICDTIARTVIAPSELPLGVVTAVIGAPVFIVLLNVSRRPTT